MSPEILMVCNSSVFSSFDPFITSVTAPAPLPVIVLCHCLYNVPLFSVLSTFSVDLIQVYLVVSDAMRSVWRLSFSAFSIHFALIRFRQIHACEILPCVAHLPAIVTLFFWCASCNIYRPRVFMLFDWLRIFAFFVVIFSAPPASSVPHLSASLRIRFHVVKHICRSLVSDLPVPTSLLSRLSDFTICLLSHLPSHLHLDSRHLAFCAMGMYIRLHSSLILRSSLNHSQSYWSFSYHSST